MEKLFLQPGAEFRIGPFGGHEIELHVVRDMEPKGAPRLEACCVYQVNETRAEMLACLEEWRLPPGSDPSPTDSKIQPDWSFPAESWTVLAYLPASFQALYHDANTLLEETADRMIRLLRWRYGKFVDYTLSSGTGLWWESTAKRRWFRFPSDLPAPGHASMRVGMSSPGFLSDFLSNRLAAEDDEPLGHRILQDSYLLRRSDPRASVLLSLTAVEVGVKSLIARVLPGSEWLVFTAPTPPLESIIRDFLPKLCKNADVEQLFGQEELQALRTHVRIRNEVTHRGLAVTSSDSESACIMARTFLFKLDYLAGDTWAANVRD